MSTIFQISPYRAPNFLLPEKDAKKSDKPAGIAGAAGLLVPAISILFATTIPGMVVGVIAMGVLPVVGIGSVTLYQNGKWSDIREQTNKLFEQEVLRIESIDQLARNFLGCLGEVVPKDTSDLVRALYTRLDRIAQEGPLKPQSGVVKEYSQYDETCKVHQEIWSEKEKDLQSTVGQVFQRIAGYKALNDQMKYEVQQMRGSSDLSNSCSLMRAPLPCSSPFTFPQLADASVSEVWVETSFLMLQDLQNLALAVIEATAFPEPNLENLLKLRDLAKERKDTSQHYRLEKQIFSELFQSATANLQRLWSEIETSRVQLERITLQNKGPSDQLLDKVVSLDKQVTGLSNLITSLAEI